jgi:hypothetical protein
MGGEIHHVLHRDYETRGVIDLARSGARKYAADRGTEIMCAAFAVDSGPVRTTEIGEEGVVARDRATVVTRALLQIIATARPEYLREHVEALLREEFADVLHQAIADRSLPDA